MTTPAWFIELDYLNSKLAHLRALGLESLYSTTAQVKKVIEDAGLTPFEHFQQHSGTEGTSPNQLFNAHEYMAAKAQQLNADAVPGGPWTVEKVADAFSSLGLSAWQHFQQFGWDEGVNPSNRFDIQAYLQAKVAQLNAALPGQNWTIDTVKAAFKANGFDPITHYMAHGQGEGVPVAPVPADRRVADDPRLAGDTHTLSDTESQIIIGTPYNDVVVAGSLAALQNGHTLMDVTTTDRDVIRLTSDAAVAATGSIISGSEVLDVTYRNYDTLAVNLAGFKGLQELHLAIDQLGNLGNATVTELSDATVVLGAGITGEVTVTAAHAKGGTILTGQASKVTFDAGTAPDWGDAIVRSGAAVKEIAVGVGANDFENVLITAGAQTTTIRAAADDSAHITTGAATTLVEVQASEIVVDAGAVQTNADIKLNAAHASDRGTQEARVTLGNDATVTVGDDLNHAAHTLTLDVAEGKTVGLVVDTVANPLKVKTTVQGAGDVTVSASRAALHTAPIAKGNAGTLTVTVEGGHQRGSQCTEHCCRQHPIDV